MYHLHKKWFLHWSQSSLWVDWIIYLLLNFTYAKKDTLCTLIIQLISFFIWNMCISNATKNLKVVYYWFSSTPSLLRCHVLNRERTFIEDMNAPIYCLRPKNSLECSFQLGSFLPCWEWFFFSLSNTPFCFGLHQHRKVRELENGQMTLVQTPRGKLVYQSMKNRSNSPKCPVTRKRI